MRLLIRLVGNYYHCYDADAGDELGLGASPDEAIGNAVRNLYLAADEAIIDDISSEES